MRHGYGRILVHEKWSKSLKRRIWGIFAAAMVAVTGAVVGNAVSQADEVQPQIIGGHEAAGKTGWMASIQYDAPAYNVFDWHTCGGTLAVARDIVIGNAHCFTNPPAQAVQASAAKFHMDTTSLSIPTEDKQFKVRVGSKDRTTGGELVPVKSITVHPDWNWAIGAPQAVVSDLAVLRLEHPVDVQPMQLAGTPGRPGDRTVLYGWGIDSPDSATEPLPRRLQQIESKVISPARCAGVGLSAKEICANNPNGTDGICYGDSGGPAVRYTRDDVPQLIGGVSRGSGDYCGMEPTGFTSQPEFRQWIYEVARSSAPPIGS